MGKQRNDAEGGHLWGCLIQLRPQGQQRESRTEAPKTLQANRAGPLRPGLELTVHGFLLEEGRHGQGPRPGGPARPGPARDWERTGGKSQPLGGFAVPEPRGRRGGRGLQAGPAEGGIRKAFRSRVVPSSGDCELRHFLEKSLLGGACAFVSIRLRTAAPEAAAAALTSAAAGSSGFWGRARRSGRSWRS